MLRNLHVKNLALIDETEVNFGEGLNILSGETGAGKSILIGSVNLALGGRVSRTKLRENADFALVELIFSVETEHQTQELEKLEIYPEQSEVIMSRKIFANGRSVCRINSETVSASLMRRVASLLIDIHGQHDHESLLTRRNHIRYLDSFAAQELLEPLAVLSADYRAYSDCKGRLEEASLDTEQQARELAFLQFEIEEIENAALRPGEDEELETEYRRLRNGQRILDAASECRELTAEGEKNASDALGRGLRALHGAAEYDERVSELAEQLSEIDSLLSDFNRDLAEVCDEMDFSEETFAAVEERLDQINHLKTKYGQTIETILAEKEKKEQKAEQLLHYEEYRCELKRELEEKEAKLLASCEKVSGIRKKYAKLLAAKTAEALRDLNFPQVEFRIDLTRLEHYTQSGWDDAQFMISTNPGEPMKPLDAVASGGELSRIMLALKTVLAEHDEIETLIFDEIDSGISGRTAQLVAQKIRLTGRTHQVICITHLPQIAAMADSHFLIEKTSLEDTTISQIRLLDRDESIRELARMLGGVKITEAVLENAREMKELAEEI